jgi:hypothetical protein
VAVLFGFYWRWSCGEAERRAAGGLCDKLADLDLNRGALVRHEFSHRIRERKGESKPAFKSNWVIDLGWLVSAQQIGLVLKFQSKCLSVHPSSRE